MTKKRKLTIVVISTSNTAIKAAIDNVIYSTIGIDDTTIKIDVGKTEEEPCQT